MRFVSIEPRTEAELTVHEIGHGFITPVEHITTHQSKVFQLHVVVDGVGEFTELPVKAGDAFLVTPGTEYRETGSFEQYWIDFYGSEAESLLAEAGIPKQNHVYRLTDCSFKFIRAAFEEFDDPASRQVTTRMFLIGLLYKLISLFGNQPGFGEQTDNAARIKEYIRRNLAGELTLEKIAASVNLSPRYVNHMFKAKEKCSISEFIIRSRLDTAMLMLMQTSSSLTDIAHAVGYRDPLYFSRVFHSRLGISPREWRKNRKWRLIYKQED